jgi:hypothetical protein
LRTRPRFFMSTAHGYSPDTIVAFIFAGRRMDQIRGG